MLKTKKSQISIILIFSVLVIIFFILLNVYNSNKLKDKEIKQKNNELFNLKKDNYITYSNDCLEKIFKKAIDKFGFETELIKKEYEKNFLSCLENNNIIDIEIKKETFFVDVNDNDGIISVNIKLETNLKYENLKDNVNEYIYDFSKISFKNLKLENNKLAFDTQIISTDENAILYLKKETSFSLNNKPISQISIKTEKKPDFSFIIGDFIYDLKPDGLKSDELMILKIRYKDEWLNFNGKKINPKKLRIAYLEENKKEWRFLPSIVNPEKKEISILTNHFSIYSIVYLESNTPIVEQKNNEIYFAGFYNGGIYSENQAVITQTIQIEEETTTEFCSNTNNFEYVGDINLKRKKISLPYKESGCIDKYTYITYELETELSLHKILVKTKKDIQVEKEKKGNKVIIYLSSNKRTDYAIEIIENKAILPQLDYPVYDKNVNIRYCFSDKEYSAKAAEEKYIHAGTDISTAGYVTSACDAEVVEIWNTNVNLKCENDQNSRSYYKGQPNEEFGVKYGSTVVLKCTEYPIYLLYMHLNPEQMYIRNPDNPKEYRFFCLGSFVKKGEIIGEASNTGSSKGIHLHFETRAGKPAEYDVPPRENAFNPALLDIFNGLDQIPENKLQRTELDINCFETFAITRGATEKELFPELYS